MPDVMTSLQSLYALQNGDNVPLFRPVLRVMKGGGQLPRRASIRRSHRKGTRQSKGRLSKATRREKSRRKTRS